MGIDGPKDVLEQKLTWSNYNTAANTEIKSQKNPQDATQDKKKKQNMMWQ